MAEGFVMICFLIAAAIILGGALSIANGERDHIEERDEQGRKCEDYVAEGIKCPCCGAQKEYGFRTSYCTGYLYSAECETCGFYFNGCYAAVRYVEAGELDDFHTDYAASIRKHGPLLHMS